ncbi:MAG: BtpA/SgcQ family protein [Phycisphaerae bacterium]|nr:BtpA/SgcQ family protein [Phycisphaerae bacterium]
MKTPLLPGLPADTKPVFGMVHLAPLPGSPRHAGGIQAVVDAALRDGDTLVSAGISGLIIENFGDTPFYPEHVPPYVVAHMTHVADAVAQRFPVPLGINVLRNDPRAALGIAHAVGAAFIRVNILSGARVTDQAVIQGCAHELLRERALLHAEHIRIFADVDVKHSSPLGVARPVEDEVADLLERGGADAVIVTGAGTGAPTDVEHVRRAKAEARERPVIVGSGVNAESVRDFVAYADAFIVGTSLKVDRVPTNPVDPRRVRALLDQLR